MKTKKYCWKVVDTNNKYDEFKVRATNYEKAEEIAVKSTKQLNLKIVEYLGWED